MSAPYMVAAGDTLYSISEHIYGDGYDWPTLYNANKGTISDPNLIYPGEKLNVPGRHSITDAVITPSYVPKPKVERSAYVPRHAAAVPDVVAGDYSCSALAQLWVSVGGNPEFAPIAAKVATAESGGNPDAISPTDDFGLWQINGSHGALATLNPTGNARAAVAISADGTDWDAWTTYTSGAYSGEC